MIVYNYSVIELWRSNHEKKVEHTTTPSELKQEFCTAGNQPFIFRFE